MGISITRGPKTFASVVGIKKNIISTPINAERIACNGSNMIAIAITGITIRFSVSNEEPPINWDIGINDNRR